MWKGTLSLGLCAVPHQRCRSSSPYRATCITDNNNKNKKKTKERKKRKTPLRVRSSVLVCLCVRLCARVSVIGLIALSNSSRGCPFFCEVFCLLLYYVCSFYCDVAVSPYRVRLVGGREVERPPLRASACFSFSCSCSPAAFCDCTPRTAARDAARRAVVLLPLLGRERCSLQVHDARRVAVRKENARAQRSPHSFVSRRVPASSRRLQCPGTALGGIGQES